LGGGGPALDELARRRQGERALRQAQTCLRQGRDGEALAAFEAALAAGADEAACRRNLARLYERTGQSDKAHENFERLCECDPHGVVTGLRAQLQRLTQANAQLRTAVDRIQLEAQYFRDNRLINTYLRFAQYCQDRADDCRAEAYVAHGVEAMPAADVIATAAGGRVYCDVVEIPSLAQRSVPYNWHAGNISLLDNAFDGYLSNAAGLSTIGWALKEELHRYGRPVTVIPNYRQAEELQVSDEIRQSCGVRPSDALVLAPSTICGGFEPIVEALRLLPDEVHLATLGLLADPELVRAMPARFGVEERVHFLDPVPYERLASVASGADIGLMAIEPSIVNDRICLPNRLFDCIAAGLPIVTPDAATDIAHIVETRQLGVTVPNSEARCWAAAIAAALADRDRLRANALAAAKALVWDSLGDKLHAAYGYAGSITFVSYRDLTGHQRTLRMVDSLTRRGVRVTVCCPHAGRHAGPQAGPAMDDAIPGARLVATPSPLPTAAVPNA
jgi:glycosyltransferase involved in cell wall biosynthesis